MTSPGLVHLLWKVSTLKTRDTTYMNMNMICAGQLINLGLSTPRAMPPKVAAPKRPNKAAIAPAAAPQTVPETKLADASVNKDYLAEIASALATIRSHAAFKDIDTRDAIGIDKSKKEKSGYKDFVLEHGLHMVCVVRVSM